MASDLDLGLKLSKRLVFLLLVGVASPSACTESEDKPIRLDTIWLTDPIVEVLCLMLWLPDDATIGPKLESGKKVKLVAQVGAKLLVQKRATFFSLQKT